MISIVAKMTVRSNETTRFKALAKELVEATRNEPGCLEYILYEDLKQANVLTFIEKYQDQNAIGAHTTSEHYTRILPQLRALTDGAPEVNLYQPVD